MKPKTLENKSVLLTAISDVGSLKILNLLSSNNRLSLPEIAQSLSLDFNEVKTKCYKLYSVKLLSRKKQGVDFYYNLTNSLEVNKLLKFCNLLKPNPNN